MTTTNRPTAAQPIDLNKVEKYIAESKADGLKATAIRNDDLEVLIALARQQHEPSGNAGEVAATIHCQEFHELAMDYRGAAAFTAAPAAYNALVAYIDAQLVRRAAPHAQAEPVGYISAGTRAMLAAGCSTPITISISTGKVGAWCAPMYLAAPVPQEAEQAVNSGDLDALVREYGNAPVIGPGRTRRTIMREIYTLAGEIFGGMRQEAEQAAPAAVTDAARDVLAEIDTILKGIDQQEAQSENGWWETSAGAEFGMKKLREVRAAIEAHNTAGGFNA